MPGGTCTDVGWEARATEAASGPSTAGPWVLPAGPPLPMPNRLYESRKKQEGDQLIPPPRPVADQMEAEQAPPPQPEDTTNPPPPPPPPPPPDGTANPAADPALGGLTDEEAWAVAAALATAPSATCPGSVDAVNHYEPVELAVLTLALPGRAPKPLPTGYNQTLVLHRILYAILPPDDPTTIGSIGTIAAPPAHRLTAERADADGPRVLARVDAGHLDGEKASKGKQRQQNEDVLAVLADVAGQSCFGRQELLWLEDDMDVCTGGNAGAELSWLVRWGRANRFKWRVLRAGAGFSGLVLPCSELAGPLLRTLTNGRARGGIDWLVAAAAHSSSGGGGMMQPHRPDVSADGLFMRADIDGDGQLSSTELSTASGRDSSDQNLEPPWASYALLVGQTAAELRPILRLQPRTLTYHKNLFVHDAAGVSTIWSATHAAHRNVASPRCGAWLSGEGVPPAEEFDIARCGKAMPLSPCGYPMDAASCAIPALPPPPEVPVPRQAHSKAVLAPLGASCDQACAALGRGWSCLPAGLAELNLLGCDVLDKFAAAPLPKRGLPGGWGLPADWVNRLAVEATVAGELGATKAAGTKCSVLTEAHFGRPVSGGDPAAAAEKAYAHAPAVYRVGRHDYQLLLAPQWLLSKGTKQPDVVPAPGEKLPRAGVCGAAAPPFIRQNNKVQLSHGGARLCACKRPGVAAKSAGPLQFQRGGNDSADGNSSGWL